MVIVLSAAAVAIGQGFARHTYSLLLPPMTDELIGSYSRAGWLGTANLASYLVGILIVSVLSTRVRPMVIVKVGLAGTVASLFVLAAAPSFPVLFIGMALGGGCSAGLWIPLAGVVSGVTAPHERGRALGLVVAGVGLSILASGQIVNLVRALAGDDAWRQVWVVEGAIGIVVLLLVSWRLHPAADPSGSKATPVRISALLAVPRWWALTGAYAAFGFGYSVYLNYIVTALQDDAGFSPGHTSTVYSLLGITSIFGGILFGPWSDRVGRRHAFVLGVVLMTLCTLAIPLGAEPWVTLSAATFGITMSGIGTLVSATVGDHIEPRAVGAAFGTVTIVFGISQALAPYVGGWVADTAGSFTPAFLISTGAFVLSVGFAWNLPRAHARTGPALAPSIAATNAEG